MNVWLTLNPESESGSGVSMQMSSSELHCSALRCTYVHVRQARNGDALELFGSCVVDISRTFSFRRVCVAGVNGLVFEFALGNAACVSCFCTAAYSGRLAYFRLALISGGR